MKETRISTHGKYSGKMLTIKEAAQYLRMGESTLYEKVRQNKIKSCNPAGKYLFNIDYLNALIENSETDGTGAK